MNLDQLKEKRNGLRNSFTKLLTKIETTINLEITEDYTKLNKIEELEGLEAQLIEKMDSLTKVNDEVLSKLKVNKILEDVTESEEYNENVIVVKTKLSRHLKALCNNQLSAPELRSNEQVGNISENVVVRTEPRNVINLPKLNITKFFGDCSNWLDFWNSYEVAIHNNDSISKIEKFTYLKSYLGGIALNAVSGFSLSEKNYDECILLLNQRFGRNDVIISAHMHKLLLIEPVKSCSNVAGLRKMYDEIEVQIRSLQSLNVATGTYSNLLCPVILQKIPEELNLNYNRQRKADELFDISKLVEFIRNELEIREASVILANPKNSELNEHSYRNKTYQNYQNKPHFKVKNKNEYFSPKSSASALVTKVEDNVPFHENKYYPSNRSNFNYRRNNFSYRQQAINLKCVFCSNPHMSHDCYLNVNDRKRALMSKGLCFICFQGHLRKFCDTKGQKCKQCNSLTHNSLICGFDQTESKLKVGDEKELTQTENSLSLQCNKNKVNKEASTSIMLQTLTASFYMSMGNKHLLRCLCDGGSSRSFILKEVVDFLNLKVINRESLIIYTFGSNHAEKQIYDVVELELYNVRDFNRKVKIKAVVIDSITFGEIEIPSQWVMNAALEKGIELADLGTCNKIHLLIGSDYLWEILGETKVRIGKRLVATDSIFGFVIQGKDEGLNCKEVCVNHLSVINRELDFEKVKTLWELETIGINSDKEVSKSDNEILKSFEQNTSYKNNRYETRLLWKIDNTELGSNYKIANRRLSNLKNTLEKNEKLYLKYREIINEHLREGIVEPVETDLMITNTGYYMPHHAVIREQKDSTKVRIVFDASSKGKDNLSLNDCLESGPNLNPDLLEIILKFRLHRIALCADIQRAFLEVGIAPEDREFLRFLWINKEGPNLNHNDNNTEVLQYTRAPFGVKCSPFLLTATIKTHLKKYVIDYSEACKMLEDLYCDDLINGITDIESAFKLSQEMIFILREASMNLRRWISNSTELNERWKSYGIDCRETSETSGVPLKILGLIWDNINDTLKVDVSQFKKLQNITKLTKRIILSASGMIFDPIGVLNPFLIRMKLLLQSLWEKGLSWDECVPQDVESTFREWVNEIEKFEYYEFPRLYFSEISWHSTEVHIFSDASPKCYGSVAYFKFKTVGGYTTRFIISKSRLAPLKKTTLPRLELLAALVSARLGSYLLSTFPMLEKRNVFFWSDSQICIYWIRGAADEWKPFVRNRVLEIKEKTNPSSWYFCSGKLNPADKLTRGIKAQAVIDDDSWILGPSWLSEIDIPCDTSKLKINSDLPNVEDEKRKVAVLNASVKSLEPLLDLEKYSNLDKILRISAYVFRFVNNCKPTSEKRIGAITANELSIAEHYWIQTVQRSEFQKEYIQLTSNASVSPDSKLYGLSPILTTDGLIVLKGRLQHSDFEFQSKHPVILPNKTRFTDLLIIREHNALYHAGVSDTLTQLRERFWIIRGRQTVKSCLHKCLRCRRFRAKQGKQVEAPLPANRIKEANPFEIVAVDFAGPLYTKDTDKTYIALFTCAVTRAIHLEVVTSLSTEHFLLAFRRFISRRGICKIVNTDNALTFKGADVELKKLYTNITDPDIQTFFGKKGITWQYIVERASWWGGYWERMVRMTKVTLRKILGRALVTFEELQTILAEIESIINSRPLTYVYNEPSEPFPLTPANFLTGKRLTSLPHWPGNHKIELKNSKKCLIKRYLYREKLLNNFWQRWRREYLLQLKNANFTKPVNVNHEFNIDDVVLIGDENRPRQLWKLGRITEVHIGRDQKVRSATVKTAAGRIKRPVQLLYHLELND